jgi:hypothetical protein
LLLLKPFPLKECELALNLSKTTPLFQGEKQKLFVYSGDRHPILAALGHGSGRPIYSFLDENEVSGNPSFTGWDS